MTQIKFYLQIHFTALLYLSKTRVMLVSGPSWPHPVLFCPLSNWRVPVRCRAFPLGQRGKQTLASHCRVSLPLSRVAYPPKADEVRCGQSGLSTLSDLLSSGMTTHPRWDTRIPGLLRSASLAAAVADNARSHLAWVLLPLPLPYLLFSVSSTFSSPAIYPSYSAFSEPFLESQFPRLIHVLNSNAGPALFLSVL